MKRLQCGLDFSMETVGKTYKEKLQPTQEAELSTIREEFPEYAALYSHLLQDVLARLDKAYSSFFRRVAKARYLEQILVSPPPPVERN